jgi:hypothetical protein
MAAEPSRLALVAIGDDALLLIVQHITESKQRPARTILRVLSALSRTCHQVHVAVIGRVNGTLPALDPSTHLGLPHHCLLAAGWPTANRDDAGESRLVSAELRGLPVDVWAATAHVVPAQLTWTIENFKGLDCERVTTRSLAPWKSCPCCGPLTGPAFEPSCGWQMYSPPFRQGPHTWRLLILCGTSGSHPRRIGCAGLPHPCSRPYARSEHAFPAQPQRRRSRAAPARRASAPLGVCRRSGRGDAAVWLGARTHGSHRATGECTHVFFTARWLHDGCFVCVVQVREAHFTLTVHNRRRHDKTIVRYARHDFEACHRDWGFRELIPLHDLDEASPRGSHGARTL